MLMQMPSRQHTNKDSAKISLLDFHQCLLESVPCKQTNKLTCPALCRPTRNWLWTGRLLFSCWWLSPSRFCSLLLNLAPMSCLKWNNVLPPKKTKNAPETNRSSKNSHDTNGSIRVNSCRACLPEDNPVSASQTRNGSLQACVSQAVQ